MVITENNKSVAALARTEPKKQRPCKAGGAKGLVVGRGSLRDFTNRATTLLVAGRIGKASFRTAVGRRRGFDAYAARQDLAAGADRVWPEAWT
jgi:hypothetical protein